MTTATTRRFIRAALIGVGIEAALFALVWFFPGAGHSPVLYTQVVTIWVVGDGCFQCFPSAAFLGAALQGSLFAAVAMALSWRPGARAG